MFELRISGVRTRLEVTGFRAVEEMSAPYELEVDVKCDSTTLTRYAGSRATLAWRAAGVKTVRHGVVSRVTVARVRGNDVAYRLVISPGLSSLASRSNCRLFQNKTSAEVVGTILNEHGFVNYRSVIQRSLRSHAFVVQYRETDLEFVQRLLEDEGLFYYFEHGDSEETLVIADDDAAYVSLTGRSASFEFSEYGRDKEHVFSLALSSVATTDRVRLRDYDFESPDAALEVTATVSRSAGSAELYDYPGGYRERNDGFAKARIRLDSQQVPALTAVATTNSPRLAPGHAFRLSGHGYRPANRTWVAVRVVHEGVAEPAAGDPPYRNEANCIDATLPYRAVSRYPSLTMQGPQTATVVGPAGEEIHVDEHGRVKVQFHWDREGQSDENSSAWIRVVQDLAGNGWGALAIPRIGQEVLVEFIDGDPRQPVIVGALYNGDNPPPVNLPADKALTMLRTRSTPGSSNYSELRFDDSAGDEQVYLRSAKDLNLEVGGNVTQAVDNDVTESVAGDLTGTVDGDQALETGGDYHHTVGKKIDFSADQEIRLSVGAASLVMKPNGEVRVNGTSIG